MQYTQSTIPGDPGSGSTDRPRGGESIKQTAGAAADASSFTLDHVRQTNFKSMLAEALRFIKNNPGLALLTAAVLGFLVARAFSHDQRS
jgi:hypothetical protein